MRRLILNQFARKQNLQCGIYTHNRENRPPLMYASANLLKTKRYIKHQY